MDRVGCSSCGDNIDCRFAAIRTIFSGEREKGAKMSDAKQTFELKVFISHRESVCDECGENLGRKASIFLTEDRRVLCLSCADLDHLAFLPSGDAALTRRSKKYSNLYAVVLKFSRARKRNERQGLLVEEEALAKAEQECLNDEDVRRRKREREGLRRAKLDDAFLARFSEKIRDLFPGCPQDRERQIAAHTCQKYSGRVGRSAAAKEFDEDAVRLAVIAHVRHTETDYDRLLTRGCDRFAARFEIQHQLDRILKCWERNPNDAP